MGLSSVSLAAGTGAGTSVTNLATLNFQVGGVDQEVIESSEAGNSTSGSGNGTATSFVVDRTLDLTVTAIDAAPVDIAPGANNGTDETNSVALTFTVENTGNATQNIALQAVNTSEPGLTGLTSGSADDFDPTATTFRYYLDDGSGVLDAADTEITDATPGGSSVAVPVLVDQAEDTPVTVFVVAQMPTSATVSADDVAAISLVAAVAEPTTDDATAGNLGTAGALITTDDSGTADSAAIEDVLADGAAGEASVDGSFAFVTLNLNDGDDILSNGQASDTSAYIIATADISVAKTVTTVCDNTNLAANTKAIPGAILRYSITVTNAVGASDTATLTTLEDIIPVNTALTVMRDYSSTTTETVCADYPSLGTGDNEFRAACTDAAGTATSGRSDCTDASSGTYTYYDQTTGAAIDSNGTAAGNTITVCYNNSVAGTGNDCTAASSAVLAGDGGNPAGELAGDEAVIIEFDVIVHGLSQGATPADTTITNIATATFGAGTPVNINASTSFTTDTNSPSTVNFLRIDSTGGTGAPTAIPSASCSLAGDLTGPFSDFPLNDLDGNSVAGDTLNTAEPLAYSAGEPVLIRVIDSDQNMDGLVAETISVTITSSTGDTEVIQLWETDPTSAEFVGAIQSSENTATPNNCVLEALSNNELTVTYTDADDTTDTVSAVVLIDPFGVVFDSSTGNPVDDVIVTLIDDSTGLPATVFSPNGIDIWPSTLITGQDVTDSSGSIFTTGPGEYRFPLVVSGNYRLEVTPNTDYEFPSVVNDTDLQLLSGGPYALSEASRGNVFFVPPGPAVQIDVPLDPMGQALTLTKTASVTEAAIGDFIAYEINATNSLESRQLSNVELTDVLPRGFRYQESSMRLNGAAIDPVIAADGRTLSIPAGTLDAGNSTTIRYVIEVTAGTPMGEAVNQVSSLNSAQESNLATAAIDIRSELFSENSFLTGRMIVAECGMQEDDLVGIPDVRLYLNDGSYVESDADGRWHVQDLEPGTHVIRIDETSVNANYRLRECEDNTRKAGAINSRFVNVAAGTLWVEDFYFEQIEGEEGENSQLLSIEEETLALLRVPDDIDQMPEYDESWLANATPGAEILWPTQDYVARQRAIKISVKHPASLTPRAYLNDEEVNALNFRGRTTHPDVNDALSTWKGVDISSGTSVLRVTLVDAEGNTVESFERNIHFSGAPYRAKVIPELSRLVADGQTPPLVAVQFQDKQGHPVRPGVAGQYYVSDPHEAWEPASQRLEQTLVSERSEAPTYTVAEDGVAYLPISPTNVSGRLRVTLPLIDQRIEEFDLWLTADARDWIMVGLAEGTWAHNSLSDNLQELDDLDLVDGFESDGKLSFFAKGRVKGDFLLTMAYDSSKDTSDEPTELLERVDPDEYYTVYGDESQLINETPSSEKLYLKLERDQFYALFGDFQTNLSIAELSKYNRTLTGLKTEFRTEHMEANFFASDIALAHVRDEIQGMGTTGRYFLSNTDIVENSEILTIEVRDRFETGTILSSTTMNRFSDYEIDYNSGWIDFVSPIASRDEDFNPIFIVADYETVADENASVTGGGRFELSTDNNDIEVGATYIREGNEGTEGDLYGVDSRFQLSEDVEIKAEVASTDTEIDGKANAWSLEANQQSGDATSIIYARRTEAGFGLNQQNASEQGTQKIGAAITWSPKENIELETSITENKLLSDEARSQQANVAVKYDRSLYSTQIGYRWAKDENSTGEGKSELVTAAFTIRPLERLTVSAGAEIAARNDDASTTYPERYALGLEWLVTDSSSIFVEQEYTSGGNDTESTRAGVRTSLWKDSQISVGVDRSLQDGNGDLSTTAGFVQRVQINDEWTADVTIDRGQTLENDSPASGLNPDSPTSSGTGGEDFTAASIGADWRGDEYYWSNRLEYRDSDTVETRSFDTGLLKQLRDGKSLLSSVSWSDTASLTADTSRDNLTISLGHANRINPAWTILNRLDLNYDSTTEDGSEIRSRKLISNNHVNYNGWANAQISLQYAGKYNLTNIDDDEYSGYTDLIGVQYRRDLSESWDVGLRAATLGSYNSGSRKYAAGASLGWAPIRDTWLELGYNLEGFQDDDFAMSDLSSCGGSSGSSDSGNNGGNTTPVANAGDDQIAAPNSVVNLDGTGSSDADGDILLYTWSLISSPTGSTASLSDPASSTTSITVDELGTYEIGLVVNDGTVDSSQDTLSITAIDNSGSGSITTGLGTASVNNLFPSGQRVSPLGSISDAASTSWAVPADVNYQDSTFPVAADLYNPYGDQHATEAIALAALDSADIVDIDAGGELITAYVYADNYFEMYVNGTPVGKDAVPFTDFNSSIIQFRVSLPFTAAMLLVDWEENLGTGTEAQGGSDGPGDGGMVAVFKDSTDTIIGMTDDSWRAQTFYTAPISDLGCLSELDNQRLSASCSTAAVADLDSIMGVHWALDSDWTAENYDDSDWPFASTYTNNQVGVNRPSYENFENVFDDIDDDAEFIWSTNLVLDNEIAVRKVQGVVTEFHFANPHVWIFMDVKNELGEAESWAIEGGGAAGFRRSGWSDIAAGDNLSISCTPTRDGDNGCFVTDIQINSSNSIETGAPSWTNMVFPDQLFSANFPHEPEITTAAYASEYGGTFPSTVYSAQDGSNRYSVTVVDFSDAREIYAALAEEINVAGAHNFWLYDQMGAISYAAQQFRLRGGQVTYDAWHHVDFIGGHQLFITNPDQTRTYAGIYRHADRLYILEATVSADTPPQGIFQQSLNILDAEGKRIRYDLQPDHSRVRVEI
eukprot:g4452.t1